MPMPILPKTGDVLFHVLALPPTLMLIEMSMSDPLLIILNKTFKMNGRSVFDIKWNIEIEFLDG